MTGNNVHCGSGKNAGRRGSACSGVRKLWYALKPLSGIYGSDGFMTVCMGCQTFLEIQQSGFRRKIMFTSLSSRNSTAKSVLFFALATAFIIGTASCRQPTHDSSSDLPSGVTALAATDSIVGTWTSTYKDYYTVSASNFEYYDGGYGYDWKGTPAGKSETDSTSGYVYIKYTSVGTSLDSSLIGKYIAISYSGLTASSAKMATAYKKSGVTSEPSLSEAVKEFTIDNGYYSSYGAYSKY